MDPIAETPARPGPAAEPAPDWDDIDLTRLFSRHFFPDGFRVRRYGPDRIRLLGMSGRTGLTLLKSPKGVSVVAIGPAGAGLPRNPPNGSLAPTWTETGPAWVAKGHISRRSRPGALAKLRAFVFLFGETEAQAARMAEQPPAPRKPEHPPRKPPRLPFPKPPRLPPEEQGEPPKPMPEPERAPRPEPKTKPKRPPKPPPKPKPPEAERFRAMLRHMEENPPPEDPTPSPRQRKERRRREEWMAHLRDWLAKHPEP